MKTPATIDDLYGETGKAEIVNGEIVRMSPTGDWPNFTAAEIFVSLRDYVKKTRVGRAVTDNAAFKVSLPNRGSFSPDAAYYIGPRAKMKFFEGAPRFAAEIRSEGDYGPAAERRIVEKRADYFAAGTLAVWDVDPEAELIHVYRPDDPDHPTTYGRGQEAEAEPAVPGWRAAVDAFFG